MKRAPFPLKEVREALRELASAPASVHAEKGGDHAIVSGVLSVRVPALAARLAHLLGDSELATELHALAYGKGAR